MDEFKIMRVLAHPVRLTILKWLKDPHKHFASQEHPLSMGVSAGQFRLCGLAQSTISAHLAALSSAGLVETKRVGQWIFYTRNEEMIKSFLAQLDFYL